MALKSPRSVLIIESRFYEDIADELARGAIDELDAHRVLGHPAGHLQADEGESKPLDCGPHAEQQAAPFAVESWLLPRVEKAPLPLTGIFSSSCCRFW